MSRRFLPACTLIVAVMVASCSGGSAHVGEQPRTGALTKAEQLYGLAPDAHPNVTYQPDVVVVGGGADSVVSASADGITWTLKPNAPHVSELAVGKVMVLTNQSTGRVDTLDHTSSGVVVKLAPVQLGEVFKDATFAIHVPITTDEIGFDPVPAPGGDTSDPGAGNLLEAPDANAPSTSPTTTPPTPSTAPAGSAAAAAPKTATLMDAPGGLSGGLFGEAFGSFPSATGFAQDSSCGSKTSTPQAPPKVNAVSPFVNTNGPTLSPSFEVKTGNWVLEAERLPGQLTFRGAYVAGPVRLGLVFRIFGNLSFSGTDTIVNGQEKASGIHLDGIDRITVGFLAGSASASDNIRARIDIPINLEILTRQLFVEGIPMVVAAKPKFVIETAFSANNSTLWSCGDYNTQFEPMGPAEQPIAKFFHATRSLLPINGVSIGVNGVVVAFDLKLQVGIGVRGAYAGPFVTFGVAVGATRGSDIGIINCQSADLVVTSKAGVGFSLSGGLARAFASESGRRFAAGATKSALELQSLASRLTGISQKVSNGGDLDFDQALYAGTIYKAHKTIPNSPICGG
jgi:hypothetical protein